MEGAQSSLAPFPASTHPKAVPGGLYITFEGPEGSGKTTQINLLYERLASEGYNVIKTKQPGGTTVGAAIRHILLHPDFSGKILPKTESLLFWADRYQHHNELVKPALSQGCIVLGDRDFDSSWAYQAYGRDIGEQWMKQAAGLLGDFKPHRTLLYMIPLKTIVERIGKRNAATDVGATESRIDNETAEFHEKIRAAFVTLAAEHSDRFTTIDGSRGVQEIHEETYIVVKRLIGQHAQP